MSTYTDVGQYGAVYDVRVRGHINGPYFFTVYGPYLRQIIKVS
jgi:hypothetical protein